MHHLASACKAHYAGSSAERDWPIRNLTWDYPEHGAHAEPDAEAVLHEINGYEVATGRRVDGFAELEGRRLDRMRLLDLLGHLRRRRQPGPAARARRPRRPEGG